MFKNRFLPRQWGKGGKKKETAISLSNSRTEVRNLDQSEGGAGGGGVMTSRNDEVPITSHLTNEGH